MKKSFLLFLLSFLFIMLQGTVLANENIMINLNDIENLDVDKSDVVSINFINSMNIPENAQFIRDISAENNETVFLYYIYNESKENYDMFICSDDTIYLSDCSSLFKDYDEVKNINGLKLINTSKVNSMAKMFYNCYHLKEIDLSAFNTTNVTNMSGMFQSCASVTVLNFNSFNTSSVIDFSCFLKDCRELKELRINTIDTSNCLNMSQMFFGLEKLEKIDLSGMDTSNVTNMYQMLGDVIAKQIILNDWDFRNVYNMDWREFFNWSGFESISFDNCKFGNTMDDLLSHHGDTKYASFKNVDTSLVTNMSYMFYECGVTELDLKDFDTSNVTNMSGMFRHTFFSEIDLSNFDTKKVTTMNQMFESNGYLVTLDLSSFNTRNVQDMDHIFSGCRNLRYINISGFDMDKLGSNNYIADYDTKQINLFYLKKINNIDDARLNIFQYDYRNPIQIYVLDNKTKYYLEESQKLKGNVNVSVLPSEPNINYLDQEQTMYNYFDVSDIEVSPVFNGNLNIEYYVDGEYTKNKPSQLGTYKVKVSITDDFYWGDYETEVWLNVWQKGNLNNDGCTDIIDVRVLLQKVIAHQTGNWTDEEIKICDLNKDGNIDIIDVRVLLQKVISNSG